MWTQGHDALHGLKLMFFYTNHTYIHKYMNMIHILNTIICNVVILHTLLLFSHQYLNTCL